MFRTWRIRQCDTVWVCKLADIVTSLWLGIIALPKELFYEILVFWTYYITSIWNKWKCVNANKWLTLISYKCMKKGSSQQQRTQQISTVNLISVTFWSLFLLDLPNPRNSMIGIQNVIEKGQLWCSWRNSQRMTWYNRWPFAKFVLQKWKKKFLSLGLKIVAK